jgi:hypothetical protein
MRRWTDGLLTFSVASTAALVALLVWAAMDADIDALLRTVPMGRLLGVTTLYVAAFGAVFTALNWLEDGRIPASLLGGAAKVLCVPLLLLLLPQDRLLGVPTAGVVRPEAFLLTLALGALLAVLPLRWLRRRERRRQAISAICIQRGGSRHRSLVR